MTPPPPLVQVRWISFHGGYDFGYLLKLLTCTALPSAEGEFFELLRLYFPNIYDIKVGDNCLPSTTQRVLGF